MATEVRETEKKYESEPGAVLPGLDDLPQVARETSMAEQRLDADYYDTADLRLVRAGITLRRRRGGSDQGWHLKLPLNGDSRREIRLPLGRSRQVPAELASLVRAYARGQTLQPVAQITTRRRGRALLDSAGGSLAEVTIDDVSARTMGEATTLTHWSEVEVELTGGSPGLLKAADKRLRHSGLHPAAHSAKLQRALADKLPAADRERPRLTPGSAAGDVVQAYARSQAAVVQALDPMIRRDQPGSVHDMRVAIRRLRGTLKSFRKILGMPGVGRIGAELKWLGSILGEARDNEVLARYLQAKLAETPAELLMGPVQARVSAYFAPRAAAARSALIEALDSERYLTLLNDLDQALTAQPPGTKAQQPAADVLPAAVRRMYRRLRRRARRAMRAPAGHARDLALHETRKAAKDARYAAEAAGRPARRFARRMKKLQAALGDQHDAVVASDTARDIGVRAHLAGENAFGFGVLYERCQQDAVTRAERARDDMRRAFRPRYARWLR
jgi:CHAD domain-containing protein